MRFAHIITLGVVAGFAGTAAATIPLDRPTPPPCCADGICHAHAQVFGVNQTRWRVWPGLSVAPMPTVKQQIIRQIPGIPAIERPKPEEEDRQAPPPTRSLAPPITTEGPAATAPSAAPFGPQDTGNGPTTPRTTTPGSPSSTMTPRTMTPQPMTPRTTTPFGGAPGGAAPGGDTDRPPTPPFSPSASRTRQPLNVQPAAPAEENWSTARATAAPVRGGSVYADRRASNDPPPAPPFVLGNTSL